MNPKTDCPKSILTRPLDLPCGKQLKNRLIKSAMSDSLGDGAGNATPAQLQVYEKWAKGGTALSLIGEVQVNPHFPEKPGNLVLAEDANKDALRRLALQGSVNNSQIWPQLSHAGALSYSPVSQPKGPSALDIKGLQCAGMSLDDIEVLPQDFARAAVLAKEVGFGGVQLHAGHGFLLSQFLSPLFNHRSDIYGGSVANRFRIVREVIEAVRSAVGASFPIGIKINATDKLEGGLTEDDALEGVRLLDQTSIDLIEVSGGTYFPGAPASSDGVAHSGAYYSAFARRAKALTSVPIILTGGIQSREQAAEVIKTGAADAVGLARSMVLDPSLPKRWFSDQGGGPGFPVFDAPPAGGITAWYSMQITALGQEPETTFDEHPAIALQAYDARDTARAAIWRKRFLRS